MNDFLRSALELATLGYRVFPLAANTKVPVIKDGAGYKDAVTDEAQIRAWARRYPHANVGVATGCGLLVVDEDRDDGGNIEPLKLELTLMVYTPSGGYHHYYRTPPGVLAPTSTSKLLPHVDTRGDGGYVVAPTSVVNRSWYKWLDYIQPLCPPEHLPFLPQRILDALREPEKVASPSPAARTANFTPTANKWLTEALRRTRYGVGEKTGYWLACQLIIDAHNGLPVDVYGVLRQYAALATINPGDPFDERSVQRWVRSAQNSRIVARGELARSA